MSHFLIPLPLSFKPGPSSDHFCLTGCTVVAHCGAASQGAASWLQRQLEQQLDLRLPVVEAGQARSDDSESRISLRLEDQGQDEAHSISISSGGVYITSGSAAGLVHGSATLLQLLPPEPSHSSSSGGDGEYCLPAAVIEDAPRFPWRGVLLDVG